MDSSQSKVALNRLLTLMRRHRIVKASQVDDPALKEMSKLHACMEHKKPGSIPQEIPRVQGVTIVRVMYLQPCVSPADQAPEVTVSGTPGQSDLNNSVLTYAEGLRIPCLGNEPYTTTIIMCSLSMTVAGSH
jgi:hypothetical protein